MKVLRYCQTCNEKVVDFTRFSCSSCGGTTFRIVRETIGSRYMERARAVKKLHSDGGVYQYYNLSTNKACSHKRAL